MLQDLKEFAIWLFILLMLAYFAGQMLSLTPLGRDSTAPSKWGARSGLSLYEDALTGCQYLSAGRAGGITPRLDASGNHICRPSLKPMNLKGML